MLRHLHSLMSLSAFLSIGPHLLAQSASPLGLTTNTSAIEGDYQTAATGAWNRDSTWARFTSGVWICPAVPPDSAAGTITVRSGHTVTITSSIVYDQLVVESGGKVVVAANVAHTLSDGPGNDLTIFGTWLNQGGTWTILGSARWVVSDSGTFIHQTSSGISTPLSKAVLAKGSNFIYRGGSSVVPASSFSGRTYGDLAFDSSGGPWSCTATGSSPLIINGNLSVGPGVKWITGGFSGNITVQGATLLAGEWSGTGTGILGMHSLVGRFEVLPTGKYQLGTTGSNQGALILQGDLKIDGVFTTPLNRAIILSGERTQTIGGSSAVLFNNGFTLMNPTGILLASSITVDGSLLLSSGTVTTGPYVLTLGPNGALNEVGTSVVTGTIRCTRSLTKGVNECFGNIGLEINALADSPGLTEVTRVTGEQLVLNGRQSILRYFDVQPSLNANLDATLTFHYRDSELGAIKESYLSLFKSTDKGSAWSCAGGMVDPVMNSVCRDSVDSFSRWTLGESFPEPSLIRISPSIGLQGNQVDVLIEGRGFIAEGLGLVFSGTGISVDTLSLISATELMAHIKIRLDAAIGIFDLSVNTAGGVLLRFGVVLRSSVPRTRRH